MGKIRPVQPIMKSLMSKRSGGALWHPGFPGELKEQRGDKNQYS